MPYGCSQLSPARHHAPQLLGLLQSWPAIRVENTEIRIPPDLVAELASGWALLPPVGDDDSDSRKKSIGNRAELYSWQLERLKAVNPASIAWVARDDDNLGYDLEDRTERPHRRIEVKGSGGRDPRFFLSENEWRKAHENPETYEIQFWGGIDLNRPSAEEYHILRQSGFPVVYRNLPTVLAAGKLTAIANRWRLTESALASAADGSSRNRTNSLPRSSAELLVAGGRTGLPCSAEVQVLRRSARSTGLPGRVVPPSSKADITPQEQAVARSLPSLVVDLLRPLQPCQLQVYEAVGAVPLVL